MRVGNTKCAIHLYYAPRVYCVLRTLLNVNTIPRCVRKYTAQKVDKNLSQGKLVLFYCVFGDVSINEQVDVSYLGIPIWYMQHHTILTPSILP